MGIAIPHGKCNAVDRPGLAAMVIKDGVDFDSLDGEPVHLLFLIAAPDTEDNIHLEVLSKLSMMLMDDNFTQSLKNASSVDEFMEIINKADEERPDLSEQFGGSDEARQKRSRRRFLQLPDARRVSRTLTWQQKALRKQRKQEVAL